VLWPPDPAVRQQQSTEALRPVVVSAICGERIDVAPSTRKKKRKPTLGNEKSLSDHTQEALDQYFESLNGYRPGDLYELVLSEVEKPLLQTVLEYTGGNQSEAASILGINRGTLRKKLKAYALLR